MRADERFPKRGELSRYEPNPESGLDAFLNRHVVEE